MTIIESPFENESELHTWIINNFEDFFKGTVYLDGIYITTISGKRGLPDGFAFNLNENEWYMIESELLSHGVWPHIAEQITRFIVAIQNPATRRIIRDHFFEKIVSEDKIDEACKALNTSSERLLQKLELFVEGIEPQVIIFIDDTNEDLNEIAQALSAQVKIFRVKKFLVDGNPEYHSPDYKVPIIETEPTTDIGVEISEYDVIETLGGGEIVATAYRFKYYQLNDGSLVHIKRSKYHSRQGYYWYGVTTIALDRSDEIGITHYIFVMGDEGFVKVPIELVKEFNQNTRISLNEDGTVRHYHCLISPGPEPELYYSQEVPKFDLTSYYQTI